MISVYRIKSVLSLFLIIIFCMITGCYTVSSRISNEKRIAIEYLNSAATFLQKGHINESVLFLQSNFNYIMQSDDFSLNTRYITTILKILNLYDMHETTLPFIQDYMRSKDYNNSDISNQRSLNFLYIDTLIKSSEFEEARKHLHRLLENREYHAKYLHVIYGYFFYLYRAQNTDFTDEKLIQSLLAQKTDEFSKMVLIKNLGLYYMERNDYTKALSMFLRYNEFVRNAGITSEIAWSYLYLGRIFYYTDKYKESVYSYFKSYYIYKSLNDYCKAYPLLKEFAENASQNDDDHTLSILATKLTEDKNLFEQDLQNIKERTEILMALLEKFNNII